MPTCRFCSISAIVISPSDLPAAQLVRQSAELGIVADLRARSARGFLLQGPTQAESVLQAAAELLADTVVERYRVFAVGPSDVEPSNGRAASLVVHVLPKPGVMDSAAESVRRASKVPIVLLTARGMPEDRIRGLSIGADDYVAKPFEPRELLLRIASILRRAKPATAPPAGADPSEDPTLTAAPLADRHPPR